MIILTVVPIIIVMVLLHSSQVAKCKQTVVRASAELCHIALPDESLPDVCRLGFRV